MIGDFLKVLWSASANLLRCQDKWAASFIPSPDKYVSQGAEETEGGD